MNTESLTKENFFNECKEKWPKAMELFGQWIDQYKEAYDWDELFNDGFYKEEEHFRGLNGEMQYQPGFWSRTPKFHDLPFDFQAGIFQAFVRDCFSDGRTRWLNIVSYDLRHYFRLTFQEIEAGFEGQPVGQWADYAGKMRKPFLRLKPEIWLDKEVVFTDAQKEKEEDPLYESLFPKDEPKVALIHEVKKHHVAAQQQVNEDFSHDGLKRVTMLELHQEAITTYANRGKIAYLQFCHAMLLEPYSFAENAQ